MSLQTVYRCVAILLITAGISAQEPIGQRVVDPPKPRVIVIETTPDIERSEVLRKVIEALEKEGAKQALEDRIGKPVGYLAQINARADTSFESLQQFIKELRDAGIEKFSLRTSDEPKNSATVTAPADAPWRQVRRIEEVLAKHSQFAGRVLVAENNDPVTPTIPQPAVPTDTRPRTVGNPNVPSAVPKNVIRPAPVEDVVVKKFALKYARVATVARIIEQLYGREIFVAADEQTNSLIMRGNDNRTQEIEALLMQLDAAVPSQSGSGAKAETSPADLGLKVRVPALGPTPLAIDLNEGASPSKVFSFSVGFPRESADELRKRSQALEQQSRELAEQLKGPFPNLSEAEKKKELLRSTVQQAFAARQALLRAENAELAKRLHALQQSIEIRDRVSQQIIDRRVDDLLNPHKQWNSEPPATTAHTYESISAEPPARDENKLLVHRSENSVKVEGHFDGNEEIILVIGDPRLNGVANTAPEPKDVKELKWTTPVNKAGDYVIELRSEPVKIDGGTTAPGLAFEVHNVPNTVQGTSYISFTDKDPLPNGKVVIASPKTKLLLKRKTDHVIVTVGHVELPKSLNVVPINIVIRRKAGTSSEVKTYQNVVPAGTPDVSPAAKDTTSQRNPNLPGDTAAKLVARLQGQWKVKFADIGGLSVAIKKEIEVRDRLLLLKLLDEDEVESVSSWRLSWADENRPDEVDVTFDPNSGVVPAELGRIECDGKSFRLCFNDGKNKTAKRPNELCPGESVCYLEGTKETRTEPPVLPKPQDNLPDDKADGSQSEARSGNGQTKIAIGKIQYSLPFSFPSVDSILSQMTEGKARPQRERIECELVKYQVSEARHYPLVGPAQLVQTHFKSTVTSEAGREVVYSDSSHLIRVPTE